MKAYLVTEFSALLVEQEGPTPTTVWFQTKSTWSILVTVTHSLQRPTAVRA